MNEYTAQVDEDGAGDEDDEVDARDKGSVHAHLCNKGLL